LSKKNSSVERIIHFLKVDVWRFRGCEISRPLYILIRYLRIILLAVRGFGEDKCQLRASALTFYTILSIVPIMAMLFGIAKGFNLDSRLKERLLGDETGLAADPDTSNPSFFLLSADPLEAEVSAAGFAGSGDPGFDPDAHVMVFLALEGSAADEEDPFPGPVDPEPAATRAAVVPTSNPQREVMRTVIESAENMLENTRGGLIAGIGVALLFWTIIKVLGNIESSFNDIWGAKRSRSLLRKFSDYLSIMLIAPLFIIMTSSMNVAIHGVLEAMTTRFVIVEKVAPLLLLLFKTAPFLLLWVLFAFIYILIPNFRVRFFSGLMGGIIAGTLYQLLQWVYITFQIGVSRYGEIYGSLAAVPDLAPDELADCAVRRGDCLCPPERGHL
jgi:YihY family inner membrane protein